MAGIFVDSLFTQTVEDNPMYDGENTLPRLQHIRSHVSSVRGGISKNTLCA